MDIIYNGPARFNKFFIADLFTNDLKPCSESFFDQIVIGHRSAFSMHYDGPNAQNFYLDDLLYARRER